jgi:parvulin-like peptidyl-prolyl cis-trans isomerase-like protein
MAQSRRFEGIMGMRLLREPLLHFAVAGAALFGAYTWMADDRDGADDGARTVHIRQADVDWIKGLWSRQWHREPTPDELRGLVADHLKEELFAREARAMKLDENDIVLRHRLAQKLSFLIEDAVDVAEPSEDELQRLYATHPDRFQSAATITFSHVYFGAAARQDPATDAGQALAELRRGEVTDATGIGDRLLVDSQLAEADEQTVSAVFGDAFARTVFGLEPGYWNGPVKSGFGLHLVKVTDLKKARPIAFAAARPRLTREWQREQSEAANEKFMAELRKKYRILVDDSVRPLVEQELKNASAVR